MTFFSPKTCFVLWLGWFFIFVALEGLIPGFVSRFYSLNFHLAVLIILGVWWGKTESSSSK